MELSAADGSCVLSPLLLGFVIVLYQREASPPMNVPSELLALIPGEDVERVKLRLPTIIISVFLSKSVQKYLTDYLIVKTRYM